MGPPVCIVTWISVSLFAKQTSFLHALYSFMLEEYHTRKVFMWLPLLIPVVSTLLATVLLAATRGDAAAVGGSVDVSRDAGAKF